MDVGSSSKNLNLRNLSVLLDTGSSVSFIKEKFVKFYNFCEQKSFYGINKSKLEVLGNKLLFLKLNEIINEVEFLIVPNETMSHDLVLGFDDLSKFNIKLTIFDNNFEPKLNKNKENSFNEPKCQNNHFDDNVNNEIQSFMSINYIDHNENNLDKIQLNNNYSVKFQNEFHEVLSKYFRYDFSNKTEMRFEMEIILSKIEPFNCLPRRLSIHERGRLKDMLNELQNEGIIRPSNSPYCSPIVLIKKKNGDLRMCVDYRTLNKITLRDNFPIPLIEDQLLLLPNKKYFTSLDLKNGFHHVSVHENSIPFTSFITPHGQFEYVKMPFGLKNAPSVFTRYIRSIFECLLETGNILIYLDDILIATNTLDDHLIMLEKVVNLLVRNNLRLNLEKCKFVQEKIEYLGYEINEKGISPNKRGIEAVTNYPVPQNTKQVHSFVGLCSYFRKFIMGFSIIAKPLYDLLRKNEPFKFGKNELEAYENLKNHLVDSPILSIFNPNDSTELHCDASSLGFGSILLQRKSDGKLHPIFYFSKRTTDIESKYHSFELETLAIIYSLHRFRIYLQGIKFKIVTDCNSLTMTLNKKEINPRIARWALELQNYDYVIEHRSGLRMPHVDALSRCTNVLVIEENTFEETLAIAQTRDNIIQELKKKLETTEIKFYEMHNGLVYRKTQNNKLLFYVPSELEHNVLRIYHDEYGHVGIDKTFELICRTYWFPNLKPKIKEHIENCLKCISFSPPQGRVEGYLCSIPKPTVPFETIHVDHCGPINNDKRLTKKHLLVIIDAFTKFVKLYAVKTTKSSETIKCLENYFQTFSRPKQLISDRGTCFTSHEFQNFMDGNNIKHTLVATGSPQANGQVERVNSFVIPILAKYSDNKIGNYWYKNLYKAEYAINNTVNRSLGTTPSKVLFGVNQRGEFNDKIREELENLNEINRDLKPIREKATENIIKSQDYNKNKYDSKRKPAKTYKIDDYVMIKNYVSTPGVSKKLLPKRKGPYKILKVLPNNRYVIGDIGEYQVTQIPYQGVLEACNISPYYQPTRIYHLRNRK